MTNPFTSRNLVKDPNCFFGRRKEIDEIYTNLLDLQSTSILGERRSGKSSLLWHISQSEIYDSFPKYGRKPLLMVFFDLQKVSNFTTEVFFRLLSEGLIARLPEKYHLSLDSCEKYQELFFELIQKSYEDFRIVVCLDEFETVVYNSQFDNSFLLYLRHFANLGKLAYVTSSREPLELICKNTNHLQGSDFWNIFASPALFLNLFTKEEAVEMVSTLSERGNQPFQPKEIAFLFELAGYHPMFLQIASFHLFELKRRADGINREEISYLQQNQLEDDFRVAVLPHFEHIWDRLSSSEKEVVVRCGDLQADNKYKDNIRNLRQRGILFIYDQLQPFSRTFAEFAKESATGNRELSESAERSAAGAQHLPAESLNAVVPIGDQGVSQIKNYPIAGKLDIWIGRNSEILVDFNGPHHIAKFCANHAKFDSNTIKRFDTRVRSLPQSVPWRLEKQEIGQGVFELFGPVPELTEIYYGARTAVQDDEELLITFRCSQDLLAFPFEFINTFSLADEGIRHLVLTHPLSKSVVGIHSKKKRLERDFYSDPKTKILLVNSNVSGKIQIQENSYYLPQIPGTLLEIQTIEKLIGEQRENGTIQCQIEVREDVTANEMAKLIRYGDYDIIHFSGHGMYSELPEDSCLFFWKNPGGASVENSIETITASQLNDFVSKTATKFIYLSCCNGAGLAESQQLLVNDFLGITHALLVGGIPGVLSMRWALNDEMAVHLAAEFYGELFSGAGLEIALLRARRRVQSARPKDYNWLSPVLVVQG